MAGSSSNRRNNKGLTLLEVIVSVGILATGIVVVMQALSFSTRVAAVSSDITDAVFLAQDTLQALEFREKGNQTLPDSGSGQSDKFAWDYVTAYDDALKLYRLDLAVGWQRLNLQENITVNTYLQKVQ